MLKRFSVAALMLCVLATYALASGTISLSGAIQLDTQGKPLAGCLLYTYQSGTTTPQNAFQDSALSIAQSNPMVCDASGRLPFFYLADGTIKIRLTNTAGVTQLTADGLMVVGPSSGSGGGGSVDATTVLATGDVKAKYGTGTLSGFVRLNGRTIGSASSGATERANADTQALFEYLWSADPNLSLSAGRGATAHDDWLANKAITLPDFRGRVAAGLCDMGASDSGRLTSTYFGQGCTTLGNLGGTESRTVAQANLPNITFPNTLGVVDPGHIHPGGDLFDAASTVGLAPGGASGISAVNNTGSGNTATGTTGISLSGGVQSGGSATPLATVQPTILLTYYCKL